MEIVSSHFINQNNYNKNLLLNNIKYNLNETNTNTRSKIPIPTKNHNNNKTNEYSLLNHFFDPINHSPPNDFLLKLQSRIDKYYHKKDINLFNE